MTPHLPPSLPASLREVIDAGPVTMLATINKDGSPQVSSIWIDRDGDELVSAHMGDYLKLRNLRRDPRCTLSFPAPGSDHGYLERNAVLKATATVTEGGAPELLTKLGNVTSGQISSSRRPTQHPTRTSQTDYWCTTGSSGSAASVPGRRVMGDRHG
ncbi:pyridoxamine 5'-phosphate oxidase family protein [Nakamurella aerolata]|uniref:pyridoxamine 5'-phosphate oxidase family protein n=1 Tax=Nakamurella aerolata TaxID=1656892 RepID=UPI001BB1F5A3|nr:pyridoxamine 5'-phosphate oxidase family protein [Nakamurella aerolata]